MARLRIYVGRICSLWWGADASGQFHARDYFDDLKPVEKAKFEALFERLADTGRINNTDHFRKESDDIYCFKGGQHRLSCFQERRRWILLHGFRKKTNKDKRLRREIERAERIRIEYLQGSQHETKGT